MRIAPATYLSAAARSACAAALLALAAVGLAACGGSAPSPRVRGDTFTIYSSLAQHGTSAREADAVAAGERLALADAHGRVGSHRVRLVQLDSSDPAGETWDPSAIEANARRAAADPTTIAYLGELDLGGSAVSVPVTNSQEILQVSPGDGLTSLTRQDSPLPGTDPSRYYPRDTRTLLRIVPVDQLQASTLAAWAASEGAHKLAIVQDEHLFGRELASEIAADAPGDRLTVTDTLEAKPDPTSYASLAATLAVGDPDTVVYTGLGGADSGPLLEALHTAMPHARLFGSSALATASPPPADAPPVHVLKPAMPADRYGPSGRRVLQRLSQQLGVPIAPEALYGYEAMSLVLDAIRAAGRKASHRAAVVKRALAPRARNAVIGGYEVLKGGDVSVTDFASYRLAGETLSFEGMRGPGGPVP